MPNIPVPTKSGALKHGLKIAVVSKSREDAER